jgi:hypothetical protein
MQGAGKGVPAWPDIPKQLGTSWATLHLLTDMDAATTTFVRNTEMIKGITNISVSKDRYVYKQLFLCMRFDILKAMRICIMVSCIFGGSSQHSGATYPLGCRGGSSRFL